MTTLYQTGVKVLTSLLGSERVLVDNGGAVMAVATTALLGSVGAAGFSSNFAYTTNTATAGTLLTAANIAAAAAETVLGLTGTLGAAANAQLPTVAQLLAQIPAPFQGYTLVLRIINSSAGNYAWTVVTNTGWTALNGTMSINQNTFRDLLITITSIVNATATIQSVGTGTTS